MRRRAASQARPGQFPRFESAFRNESWYAKLSPQSHAGGGAFLSRFAEALPLVLVTPAVILAHRVKEPIILEAFGGKGRRLFQLFAG
jgi:hypothetical protein